MKKTKLKKFFSNLRLRLKLFEIWFIKNLTVFFNLFFLVCIVLIFTGNITETTPILGPIFGGLSTSINEIVSETNTKNIINILSAFASVLITIGLFTAKAKNIVLSDIKSVELKKALVKAGLYFNSQGRLAKKIENAKKIVFNNEVNEENSSKSENLFQGIKRAANEFVVVLTANFDKEDEEALQNADKENIKVISEVIEENIVEKLTDIISPLNGDIEEKEKRKNFFIKLFSKIKNLFKKRKKEEDNTKEETTLVLEEEANVVVNNDEKNIINEDEEAPLIESIKEEIKEKVAIPIAAETTKLIKSSSEKMEEFLSKITKKRGGK